MQLSLVIIYLAQIDERNYFVLEVAMQLNELGR